MADVVCTDDYLRISHVGCGFTRRDLLALEPGSRIWLEIEGKSILFERIVSDTDGKPLRAMAIVETTDLNWWRTFVDGDNRMPEVDFIERPAHQNASILSIYHGDD